VLSVTAQAEDRSLLTIAELRSAAGVTDGSQDTDLRALGARVAAAITSACHIVADGAKPPTLRLETLSQTIRLHAHHRSEIVLARRPVVAISSVTEDGTALTSSDYEIEASAGVLRRVDTNGNVSCWPRYAKIVVAYQAGWEAVPDDLKLAAARLVASSWRERSDVNLKRELIPGVIEREWWVSGKDGPFISAEVMQILQLGGYVNQLI
jgi:hypothetical protein